MKGKKRTELQKRLFAYAAGAFVVVLLVAGAFLSPRIVFAVQDDLRCGKVELEGLERMDITSFSTGYEQDLYQRFLRFAEGLAEGEQYYVAAKELEPTSEIMDYLASDRGMYQEGIVILLDQDFIPTEALDYNLRQWKQYVIYGDDFSEGVNFLLWYIELGNPGTPVLRLLVDAETGSVYAVSMGREENLAGNETFSKELEYSWQDLFDANSPESGFDMWVNLCYLYSGWDPEDMWTIMDVFGVEYGMWYDSMVLDVYYEEKNRQMKEEAEKETNLFDSDRNAEGIDDRIAMVQEARWEFVDGDRLDFLFPYFRDGYGSEGYDLRFRLDMRDFVRVRNVWNRMYICPRSFVFGFPEIYERIPEFAEIGD